MAAEAADSWDADSFEVVEPVAKRLVPGVAVDRWAGEDEEDDVKESSLEFMNHGDRWIFGAHPRKTKQNPAQDIHHLLVLPENKVLGEEGDSSV